MSWNFLVFYKHSRQSSYKAGEAGFGLIELLVSIAILTAVLSIILIRQSSFNSAILLRGQAYEIAFQAREIQLSAIGASSDASIGDFRSVLGLHFDTDLSSQYKIFKDKSAPFNGFYDGSDEEFGKQGFLDKRFEIREIRAVGTVFSGTRLSVVFLRPNFDARFFESAGSELDATSVEIDIAPKGATGGGCGEVRTVEITKTGQISVKDCS